MSINSTMESSDVHVKPPAGDADSLAGVEPATQRKHVNLSGSTNANSAEIAAFKGQYAAIDNEVRAGGEVVIRGLGQMIPALARMEQFLSRKGGVSDRHVRMLNNAGLPIWGNYLKQIATEFETSVRTIQRKLEKHRGHPKEQHPRRLSDGKSQNTTTPVQAPVVTADDAVEGGGEEETAPVIYDSPKEQVTKWVKRQRKTLTGGDGPVDAHPIRDSERRVDTAITLLDEFQLALDDGLLDHVPQVALLRHEINKHDQSKLTVVPLHLREANAFVSKVHRHHKPIPSAKFSIGATIENKLVAVAICARPACRAHDDGWTIEVCRMAAIPFEEDDDARNACSFLYGACARIAKEMGFRKIQTYLLDSEPGMTVRGAGWTLEKTGCGGTAQGFRKNRPNGHELTPVTFMKKQRWAKTLGTEANRKAASSAPAEDADDEADVA